MIFAIISLLVGNLFLLLINRRAQKKNQTGAQIEE